MFSKYAAVVKNLRGVVLFNFDEEGVESSLNWLINRFKYRNLGLTPLAVNKYRYRLGRYLAGNPFRELVPPVPAVRNLVAKLVHVLPLEAETVELLVFASTYISPGILVGETYLDRLKSLSIDAVYACKDLDLGSWKLHLRIADYTVLDMYEWSIETARKAIQLVKRGESVASVLKERALRVERDKKRYWRIACSEGDRLFLLYLDLLRTLAETSVDLLSNIDEDALAALSIVPVVYIPPGLGK